MIKVNEGLITLVILSLKYFLDKKKLEHIHCEMFNYTK